MSQLFKGGGGMDSMSSTTTISGTSANEKGDGDEPVSRDKGGDDRAMVGSFGLRFLSHRRIAPAVMDSLQH